MANIRRVDPTHEKNLHTIWLETLDGSISVPLTVQDLEGRNPFQIARESILQTSTQLAQGGTKYDDFEPPFRPIVQEDWSGGRASEILEDDKTRYFDSGFVNTEVSGKAFLQGLPTWANGVKTEMQINMPGDLTWFKLDSATKTGYADSFTNVTARKPGVLLYLRPVGSPPDINVHIWSDTGGLPNTAVATKLVTASSFPYHQGVGGLYYAAFTSLTLTGGATEYHVGVEMTSAGDSQNYWEIGGRTSSGSMNNGSSWVSSTTAPYHLIAAITQSGQDLDQTFHPFEYKGQIYFYSVPDDGSNSYLFRAGTRGAADSNSGDKTKLNDSTQTGWTSALAGSYVMITRGPGSEERYPYRKITTAVSGVISVDRAWEITHTTDTEYVVLSNGITRTTDLGGVVTDVAIGNNKVYFLRGDTSVILRYEEYNAAGTWTTRTASEVVYGVRATVEHDENGDVNLWVIRNDDSLGVGRGSDTVPVLGPHVYKIRVPEEWGTLYQDILTIQPTKSVWTDKVDTSATQTVLSPDILKFALSGYTNADTIAAQDIPPTDIRSGSKVGFGFRFAGTSVTSIRLNLWDTRWEDRLFQATAALRATYPYKLPNGAHFITIGANPSAARVEDNAGTSWYDHPNFTEADETYESIINIDGTSAHLYIAHTDRFDVCRTLVTSLNAAAGCDLTVAAWDGDSWTNVSGLSDGTASGGISLAATGPNNITWTMPEWWEKGSDDTTNLPDTYYWIRFTWDVTPTSTTAIGQMYLYNSNRDERAVQSLNLTSAINGDDDTNLYAVLPRFETSDWIVFQHSSPFDEIKLDFGTVNTADAAIVVEYFNGDQYVAVTNMTDNTANLGKTFGKDGSIIFDLPDDMAQVTVNGVTGYAVRVRPDATLDQKVTIIRASVKNRRSPVYYSLDEAIKGNTSTANADGDIPVFDSGDYFYVGGGRRFDAINVLVDSTVKNNNAGNSSAEYWDGQEWTAVSNYDDGTSTTTPTDTQFAQSGRIKWDTGAVLMQPSYVNGIQAYWVRIKSSTGLDPVLIHGLSLERFSPAVLTMSGPTLSAGEWFWITGAYPYGSTSVRGIDFANIQCISIDATLTSVTSIEIKGGIRLIREDGETIASFGENQNLNNIIMYGEDTQNPWIATEGALYEIQTENGNYVARVPLGEMEGLSSYYTGRHMATNDVYLWFNLGSHIHRYYNRTLEHVGYTRDSGLPADKIGHPTFMHSMPGRVIVGVAQRSSASFSKIGASGYVAANLSTVLVHYGQVVHEVFQAPAGMIVNDGYVQNLPGDGTDRLWLSVGSLLCHVPLGKDSLDPTEDSAYEFTNAGYLVTGWITGGFHDIVKLFVKLKTMTKNLSDTSGSVVKITGYYQSETGSLRTGWTKMSNVLDTSPFDETTFGPQYASGRRLRMTLVFETEDASTTPVLDAYVIDTILRLPTANRYSFSCVLGDVEQHQHGGPIEWGSFRDGQDIAEQLDTWSDTPVPLRMYSQHGLFDDKIVMVEPPGVRPIGPQVRGGRYLYQLTVTEVES